MNLSGGATQADIIVDGQESEGWDEFLDVHQLADSNFQIVGNFYNAPNGFGNYDAYLGEFNFNLGLVWDRLYGGSKLDWGWSINKTVGRANIIIAGVTQSFGNGEQMYMIRTTPAAGMDECTAIPDLDTSRPTLDSLPMTPDNFGVRVACTSNATATVDTNPYPECVPSLAEGKWSRPSMPSAFSAAIDTFRVGPSHAARSGGVSGSQRNTASILHFDGGESVTTYPNPITAGGTFYLETTMGSAASGEVIISDLSGRIIYRSAAVIPAGTSRLPITTHGWAAGTYLAQLTLSDGSHLVRMVVEGK